MRTKSYASVACLSGAALLLESTLTRLLAISQFYHFAFLAVSLALLGFGASGSILTVLLRRRQPGWGPEAEAALRGRLLAWSGLGFALSIGLAYAIVNWLPFDSFTIAWDRRQILYFGLYYLALALPFIWAGLGIGGALATTSSAGNLVYGANLLGSSAGVLVSPLVLDLAGVPGSALLSVAAGLLAALLASQPLASQQLPIHSLVRWQRWALLSGIGLAVVIMAGLGVANFTGRAPLGLTLSPYKGLSHALRVPGAVRLFGRWSAISRVDGVARSGLHQMPGLSYTFPGALPEQLGISIDGNALSPVSQVLPEGFEAASYLPEAVVFTLKPGASVLVLEPGGGLGLHQALAGGAGRVVAASGDPLVARAVARISPQFDVFRRPDVSLVPEMPRLFLGQPDQERFDAVFFPLTDAYQPVTNGVFSLSETYGLTVEAFEAALDRLAPGGVLVATRWLQTPPSEEIRLAATLIEALARQEVDPGGALVAFRGIQTMTLLAKPSGWSADELAAVREFLQERRFDAVWLPDIRAEELNRYNVLPVPAYYQAIQGLLGASDRAEFYRNSPFLIAPATDDRPFFYHFFKWAQTPALLAAFGHTWQPFGGSGYFVLLALLGLVILLSAGLIIAPLLVGQRTPATQTTSGPGEPGDRAASRWRILLYFIFIGVAYLFVEIPLIQRWILYLGHPTYAFTLVVFTLLFFSGLGSLAAGQSWMRPRAAFAALLLLALFTPWAMQQASGQILAMPTLPRVLVGALGLAPLAILMGLPFPFGLAWLAEKRAALVAWAWAVNGCASVVAAVLAALLALSAGFQAVLWLGAAAYGAAFLALGLPRTHRPARSS